MAQPPAPRPMDDMARVMSEQAAVLVREQLVLARREMGAKAKDLRAGAAMMGGAGALAALASGTGTAALVLLLSRRPGASAAALGVSGAYVGAGARQGLERLKNATPLLPGATVQNAKDTIGSSKRDESEGERATSAKPRQRAAGAKRAATKRAAGTKGTATKRASGAKQAAGRRATSAKPRKPAPKG
jgi:hypothetical protein